MTYDVVPVADDRVVAFREVSIPLSADAIKIRQVCQPNEETFQRNVIVARKTLIDIVGFIFCLYSFEWSFFHLK